MKTQEKQEQLRIQCNGERHFDIGFFEVRPGAYVPTQRRVTLERKHLVQLILCMQRFHRKISREEAVQAK